jgi:hypothetical protein
MRPTSTTTVQRQDLGAIAYEYLIDAPNRGFIGAALLPFFEVPEQSMDYPKIPIESLLKLQDTNRAARGDYNRDDYEFETGTFACKEYGWEELVDDSEANLYRRFFDAEVVAVQRSTDVLLRGQEARVAAMLMNTTNIPNTSDVTIPWNTIATATPYDDVAAAREAMRVASGLTPNKIAMSKKVMNMLLRTKELKDAFKYTNPIEIGAAEVKRRLLAQYFDVDEILVGGAIKDTAKKGQAFSLADIWNDEYILLGAISNGGPQLREPILGRTFLWTGDSPQNIISEQYREEKKRSNVYRVRNNVDEAFVFTGAGYLLGNIIHP